MIHEPRHVANLITVLNPTLGSVYEPQRVMTAAVFAEVSIELCMVNICIRFTNSNARLIVCWYWKLPYLVYMMANFVSFAYIIYFRNIQKEIVELKKINFISDNDDDEFPECFYAHWQLINQKCAGDLALVEMLVNSLLGRLVDTSHSVRRLCIRGLGNVASVGAEPVSTNVLVLHIMLVVPPVPFTND